MNAYARRLQIQRLSPAIGVIGPDFERFCELFLDHVLSTRLEHSGLNALGFPISRVLDSSSSDGSVVAEYSAQSDYFTKGMPKAEKDIAHALSHRPNAKLILLISAQPDREQIVEEFYKVVMARPTMKGRALKIWGAESIAKILVDDIKFNDTAVEALSPYLPVLAEIREEAAHDRLFPAPDPRHQRRLTVSDEIHRRLANETCIILGGIAGSGKSDTAKAYGIDHRQEYDLLIWLDHDEVRRAEDLRAASLLRGQEKRNIASLMRSRRCLVVIDDPQTTLDASSLAALCGPNSHVIVTTRELRSGVYAIPPMSCAEARTVLEANVAEPCPDEIFKKVWSTVGGHPLSLALMNGTIRDGGSWHDVRADCDAVGLLPDPVQRLADRILLRRQALLQPGLAVFEWAGQPDCDIGFLRFAVLPVGIRTLHAHALTAADRDAVIRLHDVVFSSLSSLDWWTTAERAQLDNKLESYLISASTTNDLSLWSAAGSLRKRLEGRIASGDLRPAFLLALLMVWTPDEIDLTLFGNPAAKAAALAAAQSSISQVEFRLLIETFEQLYLRSKTQGSTAVSALLNANLPMFASLDALPGLTPRQTAEIHHHRGKALRWLRRDADARLEFETVMTGPFPLDATRLQLIRLYKRTSEFAAASHLGEEVLTKAEEEGDVPPSVLLAVIQDLPWRDSTVRKQLLWPKQAFIEQTIVAYANAGYDQAYKTLAAVARWWSREAPEVLTRVLAAIPALSAERIDNDEDRFIFGDILFEASRASASNADENQNLALSFFEAEIKPKNFHIQRHAELLLDMGQSERAEALLTAHPQLHSSCWIHRLMARARLAQGDASTALVWIDRALADDNGINSHDEFRELRYEIRIALGDPDALDDLEQAITLAAADRRRDHLQALFAAATDRS